MLIQHHKASEYSDRALDQFEQIYADAARSARVMALVVHPYIMGAPHRLKYFRRVLEVIRNKSDVKFWTGAQIADWYLATGPQSAVTVRDRFDGKHAAIGVGDLRARLLLVILCLIWGITWPVMKIALEDIPPLSMRTMSAGFGAVTLLVVCLVTRRRFASRTPRFSAHVFIISLLNIVGFSLFSAFAQMAAATSRVAILAYTMPIWTRVARLDRPPRATESEPVGRDRACAPSGSPSWSIRWRRQACR